MQKNRFYTGLLCCRRARSTKASSPENLAVYIVVGEIGQSVTRHQNFTVGKKYNINSIRENVEVFEGTIEHLWLNNSNERHSNEAKYGSGSSRNEAEAKELTSHINALGELFIIELENSKDK